jgi:hypothetical protein
MGSFGEGSQGKKKSPREVRGAIGVIRSDDTY